MSPAAGVKNHIGAGCLQQFQIGLERAGITTEIFVGPKLSWVDKDSRDHAVTFLPRTFHQANVPGVQRPHRRYQAHPQAGRAPMRDLGISRVQTLDYLQRVLSFPIPLVFVLTRQR